MSDSSVLRIEHAAEGEVGQLILSGRLMAESRFDLERLLREWTESGIHFVSVNCADLKFIDSAGLSTLIGAQHRLKQLHGKLILCAMNPGLRTLFEVTTLSNYIETFPTPMAARSHLNASAEERRKAGMPDPSELKPAGKPKPRTKPVRNPKAGE